MSVSDIAGLIAAVAFLILVALSAIPLYKLGKLFDSLAGDVRNATNHTLPILDETTQTLKSTNEQLEKIDVITTSVAKTTQNVSALAELYSSALGKPLVKAVSFVHGVKESLKKRVK
jgi:uncharacterized protein YoxC